MRKTLLILACLYPVAAVQAAGGREVTTEYFSDSAKTILVGEVIVGCGAHGRWGKVTNFSSHSSAPCGGLRKRTGSSIATTSMLHYDPVAACRFRCGHIHWQSCPPPSANQPDCVQPRDQCMAACDLLLTEQ